MGNNRRIFFTLSFLTCLFVSKLAFSQSEDFIRSALRGKLINKIEKKTSLESSISESSKFFKIDLNFDSYKDGILIDASEYDQKVLVFDSKRQVVQKFSMPYLGFNSSLLRYSLNNLGRGISLLVFYFSEGRVNYLEKTSKVRTYLLTIQEQVRKENIYFQQGPILMEELLNKRHQHLLKNTLEIEDLDRNGIKDIVIKSYSGRKSILVLNENKVWTNL